MSFGQFFSVLRARWWVLVLVLGLTLAITLGLSLVLPKQYAASASVVVDFKPDPISAVMFGGQASPAFMATQVDIIQSDRVALRVVRNLKLNENPLVRQQWVDATGGQGSVEQWLTAALRKSVDVPLGTFASVVPSQCTIVPPKPTAQTSFVSTGHTPQSVSPLGLGFSHVQLPETGNAHAFSIPAPPHVFGLLHAPQLVTVR